MASGEDRSGTRAMTAAGLIVVGGVATLLASPVWVAIFDAIPKGSNDSPGGFWGFVKDYLEPLATLAAFVAAAAGGALVWRQIKSQDEQLRKLSEDVETAQRALALERIERFDQHYRTVSAAIDQIKVARYLIFQIQNWPLSRKYASDFQKDWDKRTSKAYRALPITVMRKLPSAEILINSVILTGRNYTKKVNHIFGRDPGSNLPGMYYLSSEELAAVDDAIIKGVFDTNIIIDNSLGILLEYASKIEDILRRDDEFLMK